MKTYKWIVIAIYLSLFIKSIINKQYRSGTTFQIQCGLQVQPKQISKARTYALILSNAQKSMQIFIYHNVTIDLRKRQNKNILKKHQNIKINNFQQKVEQRLNQLPNKQKQSEVQILPLCILSKDNKICVFDGFINPIYFQCNNVGSVTLFIVQPEIVGQIGEDEPLREQFLAPDLLKDEKGVIIFRPDNNIDLYQIHNSQIFISNCIQSIQYFNHEVFLGIKGSTLIEIVMVNEGITGQWLFTKTKNFNKNNIHPVQAYNIPYQSSRFQIFQQYPLTKQNQGEINKNYHGIKMLIRTQNRTKISSININVSVWLYASDPFVSKQVTQYKIQIKSGQLEGKIPIQLFFYYSQHPIKIITINSSLQLHYIIVPAQAKTKYHSTQGQDQNYVVVVQQDETLYYCMQNFKQEIIKIQTNLIKSYRSKMTSALRIISSGIESFNARVKKQKQIINFDNSNQTQKSENQQETKVVIQNNKILPMRINDSSPYAVVQLFIKLQKGPNQIRESKGDLKNSKVLTNYKYQNMKLFKLLLQTSYIPITIEIGRQVKQFLFENQVKRFLIPKQKMELISAKRLKVACFQCHAFLTYNFDCTEIGCCQYAHVEKIDVKQASLMIIVKASTHSAETALIKLLLLEDQKAFSLEQGQIVQDSLMNSQAYIYQTQGKQDLQIIVNSQIQSILLLASLQRFPQKTSFDYQSNQGYIKIPATKTKKTVFIRLIKMLTSSYLNMNEKMRINLNIPYSIVVISQSSSFKLIEGKLFSHMLNKNKVRKYLLSHPCNIEQSVYLRVHSLSYSGNNGNKINNNSSKLVLSIFSEKPKTIKQEGTIQVTKYFRKMKKNFSSLQPQRSANNSQKQSEQYQRKICYVMGTIQNIAQQSLLINIMYFKQKQIYQIYPGQFIKDHILANNRLIVYSIIDPLKDTNIYVYSLNQQITTKVMIVSVRETKEIVEYYEYDIKLEHNNKIIRNKHMNSSANYEINNRGDIVKFKILQQDYKNIPTHSQYSFFQSPNKIYGEAFTKLINNLTVILIEIYRNQQSKGFESKDLVVVCTQNETQLHPGNRLQYRIQQNKAHKFYYGLSEELILGTQQIQVSKQKNLVGQKEIILQITKIVGMYQIQANLKHNGILIQKFLLYKTQSNNQDLKGKNNKKVLGNKGQPIIIIKVQQIQKKFRQFSQKYRLNIQNLKIKQNLIKKQTINIQSNKTNMPIYEQLNYNNLFLQYTIKCMNQNQQYCLFLTSLQTSQSDIRQLTPGVPEPFHINKHSSIIFIYNNNLHDRIFKFKVNRKRGLPNYKLCSYRSADSPPSQNTQSLDKCLSELQDKQDDLNLRIEQDAFNFDTNFLTGRTHELIINQYNQQYCTNCTYYLALYSDYDVVQGSIFVMSANQATFLQQGNSITTIVYRGQPDVYMLANWRSLMGIVYEIQGNVEVQVYYFDINNEKVQALVMKSQGRKAKVQQNKENMKINNYYDNVLNNKNLITINLQRLPNETGLNKNQYYISIKPANNLPSALYTLVIINKQEHIINIKDGIPYEMKYSVNGKDKKKQNNSQVEQMSNISLNPVIKYRYMCESEGVIMISTRYFQDIDIDVRCQDQQGRQQTKKDKILSYVINETDFEIDKITGKTIPKTNKNYEGKQINIKDLLKIRKSYKMSNRLDLNINPKICIRYQITITAKTSIVSYSLLVSSTDIITLPLHKQVPGMLRYQTKLYQIYEISVNEKTQLRCTFKFCQGGDGRIMIAKSKKNIYTQIYEQQIQIYQQTTFSTLRYPAKPGLFYIKIQFKGRGGVLEYTIHVQNSLAITNTNLQESSDWFEGNKNIKGYDYIDQVGSSPIRIYKNLNEISYKVLKVGYNYTQYQLQFYPIVQNLDIYEIQYYIVQSTKLKLLKKTQNCNGQYFVQLINHHQEIKQTKIQIRSSKQVQVQSFTRKQKQQVKINKSQKFQNDDQMHNYDYDQEQQSQKIQYQNYNQKQKQQNMKIKFTYSTKTPYTYITIIPIIYNKQTHEFYHLYVPKYRQVQLKNGQLFASITYFLSQVASKIQQFVDIHSSEKVILILLMIVVGGCLCFVLLAGIWFGANYFFKTKTIYVLRQVPQEEDLNLNQENEDNGIQEEYEPQDNSLSSSAPMIRQGPIIIINEHARIQSEQQMRGQSNIVRTEMNQNQQGLKVNIQTKQNIQQDKQQQHRQELIE